MKPLRLLPLAGRAHQSRIPLAALGIGPLVTLFRGSLPIPLGFMFHSTLVALMELVYV